MFKIIIIFISIYNFTIYCLNESEPPKALEKEFEKSQFSACFEEIGCLDTTEEWYHNTYRPVNLQPLDRYTIRTEFQLIKKNCTDSKSLFFQTLALRKDLLVDMNYNFNVGIVFLIHDFTSNGETGWIKHIATALTSRNEVFSNIISVDWEAGAEPPFKQAISNARVVALEIKHFVETIKNFTGNGSRTETIEVELIGHGVGAHIAGYVGTYVPVRRITALDPTGPLFDHMPAIVRLDPGDSDYVEVLHTDAFNHRSQGTKQTLGHVDFFINDANLQPQCNQSTKFPIFTALDRNSLKEGTILPACSHKRAFKYYIESLENKDCEFTGFNCENYENFINGKCANCGDKTSKLATFGLVEPAGYDFKNYYLNTNGEPPFCLNAYKVIVKIQRSGHFRAAQKGHFELIMLDKNGIMTNAISSSKSSSHTFDHGESYTFIYYAPSPRLTTIVEARLKWIHNPNTLCVMFCTTSIHVTEISIKLISALQKFDENILLPKTEKTEIENNSYAIFLGQSVFEEQTPKNASAVCNNVKTKIM